MASPTAVRFAFGSVTPRLERVRAATWADRAMPLGDPSSDADAIGVIVHAWAASLFDGTAEIEFKVLVGRGLVSSTIGPALETMAIERCGADDETLRRGVLLYELRYVATVDRGRLQNIFDATSYTREYAIRTLRDASR